VKFTDFEMMRVQELLVLRASEGLSSIDDIELDKLGASSIDSFDLSAAMVELTVEHDEAMPDDIAAKILATAFAKSEHRNVGAGMDSLTAPALPTVAASLTAQALPAVSGSPVASLSVARQKAVSKRASAWLYSGWAVAAAAASVALWSYSKRSDGRDTPAASAAVNSIGSKSDVVTLTLQPSSAAAVTGEVRWSPSGQSGNLSVSGLPLNVPSKNRYQLWIFDTGRDARFPVDAGLFDAAGAATTFIFSPRVAVTNATKFMITLEAAAGAVVSDRNQTIAVSATR
jgi:hypothetical protein